MDVIIVLAHGCFVERMRSGWFFTRLFPPNWGYDDLPTQVLFEVQSCSAWGFVSVCSQFRSESYVGCRCSVSATSTGWRLSPCRYEQGHRNAWPLRGRRRRRAEDRSGKLQDRSTGRSATGRSGGRRPDQSLGPCTSWRLAPPAYRI